MKSQSVGLEVTFPNDSIQSCRPRLVGTTAGNHEEISVSKTALLSTLASDSSNFFKSLQWSPDGTSILTSSADNVLRSYILPPALLDPPYPHALEPYTAHKLPEPTYATAFYRSYSLNDPSTCLLLASLRDLPMRLYSTLGGGILGSYPFVSPTTEAFIAPHSLLFASSDRNEVFAGSDGMIAVFDISRPGEGPVTVMKTGQRRHPRDRSTASEYEVRDGLKGIVSALDVSRDGVLAAGTFGSGVGLYDNHGYGEISTRFSVCDDSDALTGGNGITEVTWDDSGRYLCVAERNSDGVSIWDIRGTGKRLAWLGGRKAKTSQRMGFALQDGEVWAGGTDGIVRVWQKIGMREGRVKSDWEFEAHGDVVNGIGLHPGGNVLATCSGQRHYSMLNRREARGGESDTESQPVSADTIDNSLKVWAL